MLLIVGLMAYVVAGALIGLVVSHVLGRWVVDGDLDFGEICLGAGFIIGTFVLTFQLRGTWAAPLPALVALAGWLGFRLWAQQRQRAVEEQHQAQLEARAQRLIERDPNAAGGYEQLALLRLKQGRLTEAYALTCRWRQLAPNDPAAAKQLRGLVADLAAQGIIVSDQPAVPDAAPPPRPEAVDLVGDDPDQPQQPAVEESPTLRKDIAAALVEQPLAFDPEAADRAAPPPSTEQDQDDVDGGDDDADAFRRQVW